MGGAFSCQLIGLRGGLLSSRPVVKYKFNVGEGHRRQSGSECPPHESERLPNKLGRGG